MSTADIHPTAIVAAGAQIPASCTHRPVLHHRPQRRPRRRLQAHLPRRARRPSHRSAAATRIYPFACVGVAPQDLKYAGEPTRCTIGDDNTIREYVTISRGTAGGGGDTTVGSGCLIMAYTHIGHDSHIGNGCILANSATLAGHVIVEDYAVVGALCPVHQFCRIGQLHLHRRRHHHHPGRAALLAHLASSATTTPTA